IEMRRQWDVKVKAKAAEVQKTNTEVELLANGDDGARDEFRKLIEEDIMVLASQPCKDLYRRKRDEGLDSRSAFEIAMDSFIDPRAIDAYRQAVEKLNDLEKTPIIEETELAAAMRDYDAAERELEQQLKN